MSHHNNQRHVQVLGAVFDAAQFKITNDIACCTDYEQFADSCVKDQLCRNPGIRTGDYNA